METQPPRPRPVAERSRLLLDAARALTGTLAPAELYATLHRQCDQLFDTGAFLISLVDPASDTARVVYAAGLPDGAATTYAGSASTAIRAARPLLQRCAESEDALCRTAATARPELQSCISAPMIRGDTVVGELAAFARPGAVYGRTELAALAELAPLAAVAIGNANFIEEVERRRREAERLEEIGRALTASLDLSLVLERVTSAALELCGADGATVWLLDADGRRSTAASTAGRLTPRPGLTLEVPRALYERMARSRQGLTFENEHDAEFLTPEMRRITSAVSSMAVPLVSEDRLIGALSIVHGHSHCYMPDEVRMLERLGIHASIGVTNARLHEQIRALSLTDPLTGLPNRRQLELVLEREFAAAQRGRTLTVLLIDLDNFKDYNDRAGHQAGDEALRAVATTLAGQTRAMNLAARLGGDEFVAVLSGTDLDGGLVHAGRVGRAIETHPLLGPTGVRASIGVASYRSGMAGPEELLREADQNMYAQKSARRV